jgi:hypothetical protein
MRTEGVRKVANIPNRSQTVTMEFYFKSELVVFVKNIYYCSVRVSYLY